MLETRKRLQQLRSGGAAAAGSSSGGGAGGGGSEEPANARDASGDRPSSSMSMAYSTADEEEAVEPNEAAVPDDETEADTRKSVAQALIMASSPALVCSSSAA